MVHDDAIRIVKYSLEEMLAPEAAERALDFWLTVVEPFLGLPTRQREPPTKASTKARSPPSRLAFTLRLLACAHSY